MPDDPDCPVCGAALPVGARFCASCGTRVAPPDGGAVTWDIADRRTFGVLPGARVLRAARIRLGRLVAVLRARMRLAAEVVVARATGEAWRLRLRREAAAVAAERARELGRLGEAVYAGNEDEAASAKVRLGALDGRLAANEQALRELQEDLRVRIQEARLAGQGTERWAPPGQRQREVSGPGGVGAAAKLPPLVPEPPGPVIVPEPEPVPHRPPGPVIVPEPEPVPHEPPGPGVVPEPQPEGDPE